MDLARQYGGNATGNSPGMPTASLPPVSPQKRQYTDRLFREKILNGEIDRSILLKRK